MSEEEIKQKLLGQGPSISAGIFSTLPGAIVDEYGSDIAYGVTEGLKLAAHAIAEKLAEGVVWQYEMIVQEDFQRPQNGPDEEDFYYSVVGPYGEIMLGTNLPLYDGQLVRVTVTREE